LNTFICWSQPRSKQLAEALRRWLPKVLPGEEFFLSSDIEKGTLWFEAIRKHLKKADAAIICLTPENVNSAWMHFEIGAIAGKRKESRILTYMFGIAPGEISGPLGAFQGCESNKEDTRQLVRALGRLCQKSELKFDEQWPSLESDIGLIPPIRVGDVVQGFGEFLTFKSFRERLEDCADQSWFDRFARIVQVLDELRRHQETVSQRCQPAASELYRQIISDMDNYLRLVKRELVSERKFPRTDGKLDFGEASWVPSEAGRICDLIRTKVQTLTEGDHRTPAVPVNGGHSAGL
jgi:hypothetical protein